MPFYCYNKKGFCTNCTDCDNCDVFVHGRGGKDVPSNADRIRAMSDEELANFIMYGFSTDFYGTLMHDKIMFLSTDSMMEWLKQPAEEGE